MVPSRCVSHSRAPRQPPRGACSPHYWKSKLDESRHFRSNSKRDEEAWVVRQEPPYWAFWIRHSWEGFIAVHTKIAASKKDSTFRDLLRRWRLVLHDGLNVDSPDGWRLASEGVNFVGTLLHSKRDCRSERNRGPRNDSSSYPVKCFSTNGVGESVPLRTGSDSVHTRDRPPIGSR